MNVSSADSQAAARELNRQQEGEGESGESNQNEDDERMLAICTLLLSS